jgi:hypothetical protein
MRFRLIEFALATGIGLAGAIGLYINWLGSDPTSPAPSSHSTGSLSLSLRAIAPTKSTPLQLHRIPFSLSLLQRTESR